MGAKQSNLLEPQMVGATYLWQVKDYSMIPLLKSKFSSPIEVCGDSYRFELHKNGNLEIKLHQNKSSDSRKKFRCVSAFLDHRGMQHYSETKEVEIRKGIETVLLLSIPQTVIENETSDIFLMDRFSFIFKISDFDAIGESSAPNMNLGLEALSTDLGKLYSNQSDCDVQIRTDSNEYFKAHRLILSARSPVFAAMFRHNSSERLKGIINITDVGVSTLGNLLYYIYVGKLRELNSNTVTQLIQAADKYDLQELKNSSLEFLLSNLTMDNICDAAVLAETCNIGSLKTGIHNFISENTAEVINSDSWKKLESQYPELVNSILATLLISSKKRKAK